MWASQHPFIKPAETTPEPGRRRQLCVCAPRLEAIQAALKFRLYPMLKHQLVEAFRVLQTFSLFSHCFPSLLPFTHL